MEFRYFLKSLLLPPFVQIIAILAAWCVRHRGPKLSWGVCMIAVISLWVLGTPIAANFLEWTLEQHPVLAPERLNAIQVDAIVILASKQRDAAPEFGQPVSDSEQLSRVRYGAFVQRRTGLPVLLSGGTVRGKQQRSLSETMAYDLSEGYGVEAKWLETNSRTTMENALYSYPILAAEGKTSIILVTSATHMMRAKWSFEEAGFEVLAAPTGLVDNKAFTYTSLLPNAQSLHLSTQALHEWLGYWVYHLL